MDMINVVTQNFSRLVMLIGVLAFLVSVITEVIKRWEWLDSRLPTAAVVILLSLIICPAVILGLLAYYGLVIEWYMVFASFIAAFIVALVAMDGWDKLTDLADRLIIRK